MECDSYGFDQGSYYRVLVNNNPQVLVDCNAGPGGSCGESEMADWLNGRAKVVGSYGTTCGVDYGNSTDVLGIYGS